MQVDESLSLEEATKVNSESMTFQFQDDMLY